MDEFTDLTGATFAGCHLDRLLGRGGMGAVYLGTDPTGEPRALKFLAPELARDPALRRRFEREGQALQKVPRHPNVVQVFGVFEDELLQQPYIVMEYLAGRDLEALIDAGEIPPPEHVAQLALGAARGLSALHQSGLVHRDVKPGNLVALAEGGVKVVDLGLAKDLFLSGLTQPDRIVGTIRYMAPEQWEGLPATEASDVFGLGATLYHLLTRAPLFEGSPDEVRQQCLTGAFVPVLERAPHVPAPLAAVLERMLAPQLQDRYGSMREVELDLERALRGESPTSAHLVSTTEPPQRWSLVGQRRFTVGSAPDQTIHLPHPSVSPHHARISLKGQGYVLRDLRSATGTFVSSVPVADQPRVLVDGDQVRFGTVELTFHDPSKSDRAYLADVARAAAPADLVHALAAAADPRVALWCLERSSPDPTRAAAGRRLLAQLLGDQAEPIEVALQRAAAVNAATPFERLRRITGLTLPSHPAAWLGWWAQARLDSPVQLAPPSPGRDPVLEVTAGAPSARAPCGDVTLVGRDPKCQLVLNQPHVPRLAAFVVRLHRRFLVRAETGLSVRGEPTQVAFLDPGSDFTLCGATLQLRANPEPLDTLDADRFLALVKLRHPSTAAALVAFLDPLDPRPSAQALFPGDPGAAERVAAHAAARSAERARLAHTALCDILDRACETPDAWRAALAERRDLGPQVRPHDL